MLFNCKNLFCNISLIFRWTKRAWSNLSFFRVQQTKKVNGLMRRIRCIFLNEKKKTTAWEQFCSCDLEFVLKKNEILLRFVWKQKLRKKNNGTQCQSLPICWLFSFFIMIMIISLLHVVYLLEATNKRSCVVSKT